MNYIVGNLPNFNLNFPRELTKEKVITIFEKIFEVMKWELYVKIKHITRDREKSVDNYYLTRNELKSVVNSLDVFQIRLDVFKLY